MRLQTEGMPNPADRHPAESGGFGYASRAPMCFAPRRAFQGLNDHLLHLAITHFAGRSWSRFVIYPSSRDSRNRDRHLPTIPNETRSFRATDLLSSPSALASTTRALRARSDWLRARCATDCSRSRSSSLRISGFRVRRVRISTLHLLDAIRPNLVYLFLGQETSSP